nr:MULTISPECIES: peptidylprolyl isomerase [Pacificimonas]
MSFAAAAQDRAVPDIVPDENILNLDLSTGGRVRIILRPDIAPNHVERIRTLAEQGFYDGVVFHRVIPGFMAQTGDPLGTGQGSSDLPDLEAEFTRTPHLRGTVSMARAQAENSANSQFFIVYMPTTTLDENYTVFGRVFDGMQFVDAIAPGEPPANPDRIVQARIGRNVPQPSSDMLAAAPASREASAGMDALTSAMPEGFGDTPTPDAPARTPPVEPSADGPADSADGEGQDEPVGVDARAEEPASGPETEDPSR